MKEKLIPEPEKGKPRAKKCKKHDLWLKNNHSPIGILMTKKLKKRQKVFSKKRTSKLFRGKSLG